MTHDPTPTALSRASEALHAHTKADIESHRLSHTEFAILEALYDKCPMPLGEIQKKILVSSGGITFLAKAAIAAHQ